MAPDHGSSGSRYGTDNCVHDWTKPVRKCHHCGLLTRADDPDASPDGVVKLVPLDTLKRLQDFALEGMASSVRYDRDQLTMAYEAVHVMDMALEAIYIELLKLTEVT